MPTARILYVDDESDNLAVFKRSFQRIYDIHTCLSGQEALDILKHTSFDIVVSDQRMPGMTGVELFEKLREESHESARILLTGYADMQAVVDCINKGHIFFYCTKPWNSDEMKLVFNKAMEFVELNRRNKILLNEVTNSVTELYKLNQASSEILSKFHPTS